MQYKKLFLFFFCLHALISNGQNMVINPSFEDGNVRNPIHTPDPWLANFVTGWTDGCTKINSDPGRRCALVSGNCDLFDRRMPDGNNYDVPHGGINERRWQNRYVGMHLMDRSCDWTDTEKKYYEGESLFGSLNAPVTVGTYDVSLWIYTLSDIRIQANLKTRFLCADGLNVLSTSYIKGKNQWQCVGATVVISSADELKKYDHLEIKGLKSNAFVYIDDVYFGKSFVPNISTTLGNNFCSCDKMIFKILNPDNHTIYRHYAEILDGNTVLQTKYFSSETQSFDIREQFPNLTPGKCYKIRLSTYLLHEEHNCNYTPHVTEKEFCIAECPLSSCFTLPDAFCEDEPIYPDGSCSDQFHTRHKWIIYEEDALNPDVFIKKMTVSNIESAPDYAPVRADKRTNLADCYQAFLPGKRYKICLEVLRPCGNGYDSDISCKIITIRPSTIITDVPIVLSLCSIDGLLYYYPGLGPNGQLKKDYIRDEFGSYVPIDKNGVMVFSPIPGRKYYLYQSNPTSENPCAFTKREIIFQPVSPACTPMSEKIIEKCPWDDVVWYQPSMTGDFYTIQDPDPNDYFDYNYKGGVIAHALINGSYRFRFYDTRNCTCSEQLVTVRDKQVVCMQVPPVTLYRCSTDNHLWYIPEEGTYDYYTIDDPVPGDWYDYNYNGTRIAHDLILGNYKFTFYDKDNCTCYTQWVNVVPKENSEQIREVAMVVTCGDEINLRFDSENQPYTDCFGQPIIQWLNTSTQQVITTPSVMVNQTTTFESRIFSSCTSCIVKLVVTVIQEEKEYKVCYDPLLPMPQCVEIPLTALGCIQENSPMFLDQPVSVVNLAQPNDPVVVIPFMQSTYTLCYPENQGPYLFRHLLLEDGCQCNVRVSWKNCNDPNGLPPGNQAGFSGIGDISSNFHIVPNPGTTMFVLRNTISQNVIIDEVSIMDMTGLNIYHYQNTSANDFYNIADLAAGMYTVYVKYGGQVQALRLIKQ